MSSRGYRVYVVSICAVAVVIGVWRLALAWKHDATMLNFTTLGFLLTPVLLGLLANASELSFGADGVTWKRQVTSKLDSTDASVKQLGELVEQLKTITASGVGGRRAILTQPSAGLLPSMPVPGMARAPLPPTTGAPAGGLSGKTVVDPDDPQKGQWGGLAERNHRRISAKVDSLKDDPSMFEVAIWVESTDPVNHPLTGAVKFHLHDTFTPKTVRSTVRTGVAHLVRYAWGAFTVGAEADDGGTTLELDLAELPDAPKGFREN